MNEKNLITYYNKFNEDKRLTRRHGIIEYRTATKYIHEYLFKDVYEFEQNKDYVTIIEKKAEDLYRTIHQKIKKPSGK